MVDGIALMLVRLSHNEVLDVGEWAVVVLFREFTERVVLMEELYNMSMER